MNKICEQCDQQAIWRYTSDPNLDIWYYCKQHTGVNGADCNGMKGEKTQLCWCCRWDFSETGFNV